MRFLVFQHVDVEHPGSFREVWREAGIAWDAVEIDAGEPIPAFEGYDCLVVMGGPQDVWQVEEYPWLVPEKAAIRRWVKDLGKPYLGVCLGHQLLADALGGAVGLSPRPEVGLADVRLTQAGRRDPVFSRFPDTIETFQWHGAEVTRLPEGAVVLAENDACAVQAMRVGALAYGVQYHVEITASTVSDWQAIPAYAASLEKALGPQRAKDLAPATLARLPAFAAAARTFDDALRAVIARAGGLA